MTAAVIACARLARQLPAAYEHARQAEAKKTQTRGTDRYLFRHWFFDHACHKIAANVDGEPYWYFWRHDWYNPRKLQVVEPIDRELEKFANFAISNLARSDDKSRDRLIALVDELVNEDDIRHHHNAFFLIRHSEPIAIPGEVTIVDERFHGALRTIATDRRLSYLRSIVPGFIEANLPDLRRDRSAGGRRDSRQARRGGPPRSVRGSQRRR
jgi:hypothetical protein